MRLLDFWDISVAPGTASGPITVPVTLQFDGSILPGAVFNPVFGRFMDYSFHFGEPFSFNVFTATGSLTAAGNYSQTFSGNVVLPYSVGQPLTAIIDLSMMMMASGLALLLGLSRMIRTRSKSLPAT